MTTVAMNHQPMPLAGKVAIGVLGVTALLLGAVASLAFFVAGQGVRPLPQPVTITACTVESFVEPEPGDRHRQADCERWFSRDGSASSVVGDQVIEIAGQVCLDHDESVAYTVTVAWESLTTDTRAVVLQTPLTWDPGCGEPYSFPYEIPSFLFSGSSPGEAIGRWRLVGTAEPVESTRFATYQWDATGSVTIIAP